MRYVSRDENGKIEAIFSYPVEGAEETLEDADPDLVAFVLGGESDSTLRAYLASTDSELLRIIEDVVNVLVENNLVLLTDFPEAAQTKLMRRHSIREKLQVF
jgi:hypothetical protein